MLPEYLAILHYIQFNADLYCPNSVKWHARTTGHRLSEDALIGCSERRNSSKGKIQRTSKCCLVEELNRCRVVTIVGTRVGLLLNLDIPSPILKIFLCISMFLRGGFETGSLKEIDLRSMAVTPCGIGEFTPWYTRFSREIGTKLRESAVGQAGGCCYSRAALSSNDSKTL